MESPCLYIMMPCFNEEAGLQTTVTTVLQKLDDLIQKGFVGTKSAMLFVDDGSHDRTWGILEEAHRCHPERVKAIRFAGNRGKEYALLAGIQEAARYADLIVCTDADLQFDIDAIDTFLEKQKGGYDIVYGVKRNRGKESMYKTFASGCFYGLMSKLGSPIIPNHTDYCLMTRQVAEALSEYGEANVIFRGMLRSLGFKQYACPFDVKDREAGESHFHARKLIELSLDAITAFSVAPLRHIGAIGSMVFMVGIAMIIWTIIDVCRGITPSGYATLNCSLWFLGGLGMLCMSVVGGYIGKLYMEAKKRPRYYIRQRLH